jgi:hypothetical protein
MQEDFSKVEEKASCVRCKKTLNLLSQLGKAKTVTDYQTKREKN